MWVEDRGRERTSLEARAGIETQHQPIVMMSFLVFSQALGTRSGTRSAARLWMDVLRREACPRIYLLDSGERNRHLGPSAQPGPKRPRPRRAGTRRGLWRLRHNTEDRRFSPASIYS